MNTPDHPTGVAGTGKASTTIDLYREFEYPLTLLDPKGDDEFPKSLRERIESEEIMVIPYEEAHRGEDAVKSAAVSMILESMWRKLRARDDGEDGGDR